MSPTSDRFAGRRGTPCTHVGEGRHATAQARAFPFPRSVRVRVRGRGRGRGSCSRSTDVVHTHHVSLDWDAARVYDRVKPASTVAFRTDRSARLRGEASAHEIERHGGVSRAHVSLEGGRRACERLEGDMDPPWRRAKRSLYAKLVRPILSSLEKGADVRRVADSLAVGFCIGLFPVFGACVREEDRGEGNARRGRRG